MMLMYGGASTVPCVYIEPLLCCSIFYDLFAPMNECMAYVCNIIGIVARYDDV